MFLQHVRSSLHHIVLLGWVREALMKMAAACWSRDRFNGVTIFYKGIQFTEACVPDALPSRVQVFSGHNRFIPFSIVSSCFTHAI